MRMVSAFMGSGDRRPFWRRRRTWLWFALLWFVFVNGFFYWGLYHDRVAEIPRIWDRLVTTLR